MGVIRGRLPQKAGSPSLNSCGDADPYKQAVAGISVRTVWL